MGSSTGTGMSLSGPTADASAWGSVTAGMDEGSGTTVLPVVASAGIGTSTATGMSAPCTAGGCVGADSVLPVTSAVASTRIGSSTATGISASGPMAGMDVGADVGHSMGTGVGVEADAGTGVAVGTDDGTGVGVAAIVGAAVGSAEDGGGTTF